MKKVVFFVFVLLLFWSCHQSSKRNVSTSVDFIAIDSSLDKMADTNYIQMVDSLNSLMDAELNTELGFCPKELLLQKPECELLNWVTDAIWEYASTHFDQKVDVAVMNIGGLRCKWNKGMLCVRDIFMLMPFNNELCLLELSGQDLLELCQIICMVGGQGISHMQILGENKQLISATVNGQNIDTNRIYYVATSDYLASGKDNLTPLAKHTRIWYSNTLIRDILQETIHKQKTLDLHLDNRIILNDISDIQ